MARKRKSKPTQPKPTPSPYGPPTSRGIKRQRQSSEAETEIRDESNRTPTVPKTPNGLIIGTSPEEQLQREVQENNSHLGSLSTKRRKRPNSDFSYSDIQFKYRIISGPGKDTPRKKRRIDGDEGKSNGEDSPPTTAQKARMPSLIDSPSVPIVTSRPRFPAGPSSTPNPKKQQQHNSRQQSHTERRPRVPGVFSPQAIKPSKPLPRKPSSFELLGGSKMGKRATEREERSARREGQNQKKGKESTTSAKSTPAKLDARARGHIQPQNKTSDRVSSRRESAHSIRDPGPSGHAAPPDPLAPGSSQRPPAQGPVITAGAAVVVASSNRNVSGEQGKLADIMRARAEAAKKGIQSATLWAEQQKLKARGTTK